MPALWLIPKTRDQQGGPPLSGRRYYPMLTKRDQRRPVLEAFRELSGHDLLGETPEPWGPDIDQSYAKGGPLRPLLDAIQSFAHEWGWLGLPALGKLDSGTLAQGEPVDRWIDELSDLRGLWRLWEAVQATESRQELGHKKIIEQLKWVPGRGFPTGVRVFRWDEGKALSFKQLPSPGATTSVGTLVVRFGWYGIAVPDQPAPKDDYAGLARAGRQALAAAISIKLASHLSTAIDVDKQRFIFQPATLRAAIYYQFGETILKIGRATKARTCAMCGQPYMAKKRNALFCSPACRQRDFRLRHSATEQIA